jgi:hypothetical protein
MFPFAFIPGGKNYTIIQITVRRRRDALCIAVVGMKEEKDKLPEECICDLHCTDLVFFLALCAAHCIVAVKG